MLNNNKIIACVKKNKFLFIGIGVLAVVGIVLLAAMLTKGKPVEQKDKKPLKPVPTAEASPIPVISGEGVSTQVPTEQSVVTEGSIVAIIPETASPVEEVRQPEVTEAPTVVLTEEPAALPEEQVAEPVQETVQEIPQEEQPAAPSADDALLAGVSGVMAARTEETNIVLSYTNQYRAELGIAPLTLDGQLTRLAFARAREMAESQVLSHTRPNGEDIFGMLQAYYGSFQTAGENIANGTTGAFPADQICRNWKNSPAHYQNIINAEYQKIGFGMWDGTNGMTYWCQVFAGE